MTLKDLVSKVTIQGDVRVSIWDELGEEEVRVLDFFGLDRLSLNDVSEVKMMRIKYMFVGGDGILHIELVPKCRH